jgi:hypothetical protein
MRKLKITGLLVAATALQGAGVPRRLLDEGIRGWTPEARAKINALLMAKGSENPAYDPARRPVAAFDWDNTIYKNDIGDATMYWMLGHDRIRQPAGRDWAASSPHLTSAARSALGAACGPLAEPGRHLSTWGASGSACADEILAVYDAGRTVSGEPAWDQALTLTQNRSYAWLAQLQAGYTRQEIGDFSFGAYLGTSRAGVGLTQRIGSRADLPAWGRIYEPMRDLIGAFAANGFDVWVVTASPQFVVERISAQVGVARDHVIGIRTVQKDGVATVDLQGCGGVPDGPEAPMTFDTGKRCWLNKVVFGMPDGSAQLAPNPDPAKRPVFAAGDSDTDIAFMQDATDLKLAINRNRTQLMCNAYANHGGRWVVQPMFIEPKPAKASPYLCSSALDHAGRPIRDEAGKPIPDQVDRVFTLGN